MWIEITVMPREQRRPRRPAPRRDRMTVAQDSHSESRKLHDDVMRFLKTNGLMGAVKQVSEPGYLPMVTVHGTQQVLEQFRQAPEFEAGCSSSLGLHT